MNGGGIYKDEQDIGTGEGQHTPIHTRTHNIMGTSQGKSLQGDRNRMTPSFIALELHERDTA